MLNKYIFGCKLLVQQSEVDPSVFSFVLLSILQQNNDSRHIKAEREICIFLDFKTLDVEISSPDSFHCIFFFIDEQRVC